MLLTKFDLIGDTAQLALLFFEISSLQGIPFAEAVDKVVKMEKHVNPTKHKAVQELLSDQEYLEVARRHSLDIELYYWAALQVKALKQCFFEGPLPYTEKDVGQVCRERGIACLLTRDERVPSRVTTNVTFTVNEWWDEA